MAKEKKPTHKERAIERLGDISTIDPSLARAMIRLLKATMSDDDGKLPSGPISFHAFHDAMVASLDGFYSPVDIPFGDMKRTATVLSVALKNQTDLDAFAWWVRQQGWLATDPSLNRVINALARSIVDVRRRYRAHLEAEAVKRDFIDQAEQITGGVAGKIPVREELLLFPLDVLPSPHG